MSLLASMLIYALATAASELCGGSDFFCRGGPNVSKVETMISLSRTKDVGKDLVEDVYKIVIV